MAIEMWEISFHPKAGKELEKLPKKTRVRVREAINELQKFPNVDLDIAVLTGIKVKGHRILRVKLPGYRIAFVPLWSEKKIVILMVGKREDFYKKLKKRVSFKP